MCLPKRDLKPPEKEIKIANISIVLFYLDQAREYVT